MRKTYLVAAAVLLLSTPACTESDSPTVPAKGPQYDTGWMGGGGRVEGSDSTNRPSTPDGTGWMGGGGRITDSTAVNP
jgi:hypothetical protein